MEPSGLCAFTSVSVSNTDVSEVADQFRCICFRFFCGDDARILAQFSTGVLRRFFCFAGLATRPLWLDPLSLRGLSV
jgi:hypothetical protein